MRSVLRRTCLLEANQFAQLSILQPYSTLPPSDLISSGGMTSGEVGPAHHASDGRFQNPWPTWQVRSPLVFSEPCYRIMLTSGRRCVMFAALIGPCLQAACSATSWIKRSVVQERGFMEFLKWRWQAPRGRPSLGHLLSNEQASAQDLKQAFPVQSVNTELFSNPNGKPGVLLKPPLERCCHAQFQMHLCICNAACLQMQASCVLGHTCKLHSDLLIICKTRSIL